MTLYLDTSVFGGYFDKVFEKDTRDLFDFINKHKIQIIASETVMHELKPAREQVRNVIHLLHSFDLVHPSSDVYHLANKYIDNKVIHNASRTDAIHIATATLQGATTVVSWNMKHMVSRQSQFNMVNLREGYKTIHIHKPSDVLAAYEDRNNIQ